MGSPPQVRGKPQVQGVTAVYTGITPAGAGKTAHTRDKCARRQDHPRRCGENRSSHRMPVLHDGSPPQVRGKRRPTAA